MGATLGIKERITEALSDGPLPYTQLADTVFPEADFPRAWRCANQGGPPGCYMALSRAIREMGLSVDRNGHTRIVYPPNQQLRESNWRSACPSESN